MHDKFSSDLRTANKSGAKQFFIPYKEFIHALRVIAKRFDKQEKRISEIEKIAFFHSRRTSRNLRKKP